MHWQLVVRVVRICKSPFVCAQSDQLLCLRLRFFGCNLESFCFLYKCRNAHTCKCVYSTEKIFAACDSFCILFGNETMQFTVRLKCMQCISIGFARCNGVYWSKKFVCPMWAPSRLLVICQDFGRKREREEQKARIRCKQWQNAPKNENRDDFWMANVSAVWMEDDHSDSLQHWADSINARHIHVHGNYKQPTHNKFEFNSNVWIECSFKQRNRVNECGSKAQRIGRFGLYLCCCCCTLLDACQAQAE